jgi:hypothetical protein
MRICFLLLVILFSALLNSFQLEYTLKDDCEYFDKRSFVQTALYLTTPTVDQLDEYDFLNANSLIYSFEYGTNKLLLIREIKENSETIKIYNQGLNKFFSFDFDEGIKSKFKEPSVIKFNPTGIEKSCNDIVLHLNSIVDDSLLMTRKDIRSGTINFNGIDYGFYLINNDFSFSQNDSNCKFYIDHYKNGKYDQYLGVDECRSIGDSFEFLGKTYAITLVSADGFNFVIEEAELSEKIAVGYLMPNFEYKSFDIKKTYNRADNKVTFIYWWSPKCIGAVSGVPAVNKIWDKYSSREDFDFIALSIEDKALFESIDNKVKTINDEFFEIKFPTGAGNSTLKILEDEPYPKVIIIDADGIIKMISGCSTTFEKYDEAKDGNLKKFDTILEKLLN